LAPVRALVWAFVAGVAFRAQRAIVGAVYISVGARGAGARHMRGVDEVVALGDDVAEGPA